MKIFNSIKTKVGSKAQKLVDIQGLQSVYTKQSVGSVKVKELIEAQGKGIYKSSSKVLQLGALPYREGATMQYNGNYILVDIDAEDFDVESVPLNKFDIKGVRIACHSTTISGWHLIVETNDINSNEEYEAACMQFNEYLLKECPFVKSEWLDFHNTKPYQCLYISKGDNKFFSKPVFMYDPTMIKAEEEKAVKNEKKVVYDTNIELNLSISDYRLKGNRPKIHLCANERVAVAAYMVQFAKDLNQNPNNFIVDSFVSRNSNRLNDSDYNEYVTLFNQVITGKVKANSIGVQILLSKGWIVPVSKEVHYAKELHYTDYVSADMLKDMIGCVAKKDTGAGVTTALLKVEQDTIIACPTLPIIYSKQGNNPSKYDTADTRYLFITGNSKAEYSDFDTNLRIKVMCTYNQCVDVCQKYMAYKKAKDCILGIDEYDYIFLNGKLRDEHLECTSMLDMAQHFQPIYVTATPFVSNYINNDFLPIVNLVGKNQKKAELEVRRCESPIGSFRTILNTPSKNTRLVLLNNVASIKRLIKEYDLNALVVASHSKDKELIKEGLNIDVNTMSSVDYIFVTAAGTRGWDLDIAKSIETYIVTTTGTTIMDIAELEQFIGRNRNKADKNYKKAVILLPKEGISLQEQLHTEDYLKQLNERLDLMEAWAESLNIRNIHMSRLPEEIGYSRRLKKYVLKEASIISEAKRLESELALQKGNYEYFSNTGMVVTTGKEIKASESKKKVELLNAKDELLAVAKKLKKERIITLQDQYTRYKDEVVTATALLILEKVPFIYWGKHTIAELKVMAIEGNTKEAKVMKSLKSSFRKGRCYKAKDITKKVKVIESVFDVTITLEVLSRLFELRKFKDKGEVKYQIMSVKSNF